MQPFPVVPKMPVLQKYVKIQRKKTCDGASRKLWYRFFPVNFAQFLRAAFSRAAPSDCLYRTKHFLDTLVFQFVCWVIYLIVCLLFKLPILVFNLEFFSNLTG